MHESWNPGSWRSFSAAQQPKWPDEIQLKEVLHQIAGFPPLVFAGEARSLKNQLAAASEGKAFVLQAGDCAESFSDLSADVVRDKFKVILQMSLILSYGAGLPVIKIGRIAGQYAKPRSSDTETINGVELPSFRGDNVNSEEPFESARVPDPNRMATAYHYSASTLNLLRALSKGGFADLRQAHIWNQEFVESSSEGERYSQIANEIERALQFFDACNVMPTDDTNFRQVDFYTSHEALLLDFEEAMTRRDSLTDEWYGTSAHMLWIGERTRQLTGAHIEYASGINNPIAVKVGPTADPKEIVAIANKLNPDRKPGRLSLIARMGKDKIADALPSFVEAVRDSEHPVVWMTDPMHGNTTVSNGKKTRHFEDVMSEITTFFQVHHSLGTIPGGIHLELTGENVTECLGGSEEILEDHLHHNYQTLCDPRLNARQSLDVAFRVAELLRS